MKIIEDKASIEKNCQNCKSKLLVSPCDYKYNKYRVTGPYIKGYKDVYLPSFECPICKKSNLIYEF